MAETHNSEVPRLGFQTRTGTIWFEFSPEKLKEYFVEMEGYDMVPDMLRDISSQTVLDMSSFTPDDSEGSEVEERGLFGGTLQAIVDSSARENTRLQMLKFVFRVFLRPEYVSLRKEVDNLLDVDLMEAKIATLSAHNMRHKAMLLARHQAWSGITQIARNLKDEFRVRLLKHRNRNIDNLEIISLFFPYVTDFGSFLITLRDHTICQKEGDGGFTLEDGPWEFRLENERNNGWNLLDTEASYDEMVCKVKSSNGVALVFHSVEYAIAKAHAEQRQKDLEIERERMEEILDKEGVPFFNEGSFLSYLRRQMGERFYQRQLIPSATLLSLPQTNEELHSQLTFKTSSTKKRKISQGTVTNFDNNPEVPLDSIEDQEVPQYVTDLPRFVIPASQDSQPSLPPHIPSHLHSEASFSTQDYISSAASSPSAAYAGLSIESERGGDMSGSEGGAGTGNTDTQETRSQSPNRSFAHRAIMGGAADFPQRSSSPLKRPASDLEQDPLAKDDDDVEMDTFSPLEASGAINGIRLDREQSRRSTSMAEVSRASSQSQDPPDRGDNKPKKESDSPDPNEHEMPPIDEQIKAVMQIIETHNAVQLQPGENTYVISKKWLSRVQARGSGVKVSNKGDLEGEIGPIDNSDILQEILQDGDGEHFVRLKPELPRSTFEYFPEEAWQYVMKLYGLREGQLPILRKAVNTNPDRMGIPNVEYELHPPVFVVHRLWSAISPIPLSQLLKAKRPNAPVFVVSRGDSYMEFLRKIKRAAEVEPLRKVRVWKLPRRLATVESIAASIANEASPPPSRGNTPGPETQSQPQDSWRQLLVDVESFTALERTTQRQLIDVDDQTTNKNYNGHMTVEVAGLGIDQALVLDEYADVDWLSQYRPKDIKEKISTSIPVTVSRTGITHSKSAGNSGRNSPAPTGPMTRGRTQKSGRTIGTVGLSNLGNTCYMNSALQCVRSVEELTKYFLTHQAEKEINRDNPLGNNGEVAVAYGALLEEIYKDTPPTSVVPRYFKTTIGKYAPSFSGYGQQDSQEFLGFLLDGLQEDLSRVKKKPYIEKPDSTDEMVGNPVAIREMAAKVWDITKKRDDSVIADLFTGMYKSTLVCPICAKVSITFDPFNNLTLQLPIENSWSHDVYYFPLNDRPIRISVDMDKQGSIKALKEFISSRVGVPVERLFVAEEFKCRFYKFYDDMKSVSEEIQTNDQVAVYELETSPTNWPAPKKPAKQKIKSMLTFSHYNDPEEDDIPNWDDPMAERMLIPVLHRQPSPETNHRYRKPWQHAPVPHFIMVTAAEARSEEAIKRKILEKVATLTTHHGLEYSDQESEDEDMEPNDNVDPDLVVTSVSDADSSGDGKVVATSIDGEDELVDVTMNDTNGVQEQTALSEHVAAVPPAAINRRKRKFRSHRPKWADPKEYMDASFQNMFQLSYYTGTKELVPVGWGSVDEDKEYPKLSSRDPRVLEAIEEEERRQEELTANGQTHSEASSDVDEDDAPQLVAPTRMNEESSDEDEPAPINVISRALPVRPVAQRAGMRGTKLAMQRQQRDEVEDAPDDGPLVRLGEGIVVDWNAEAHECMFGGDEHDNFRGAPTYTAIELMEDPELEAKRKARMHRKKEGLSLDECLDEFGKEEILSEMDTWYCPRCKEHRRASKKFELWKTPDILVMHLKRFSSSALRRDKVDVLVRFPIEGLDLTSRVVEKEDGKEEIYDLFAVDDHWGGLGGGHYTAFAKSFVDGKWYEYNDSSVSEQKELSRMVSSGAYLLFYRRRSSVPLGGPRFKEIVEHYNNPPEPSEDEDEPGEDQRLVADSSLRGSSRALTGAGAAHPPAGGSGGVAMTRSSNPAVSGGAALQDQKTINPADLETPPSYQSTLEDDDAAPLMVGDAMMNDGLDIQDEGIDMNLGYSNLNSGRNTGALLGSSWTFSGLKDLEAASSTMANPSGRNSDLEGDDWDDRSDVVQNNSSASDGSRTRRVQDFDNTEPDEEWRNPSPIPDISDQDQMTIMDLHGDHLTRVGSKRLGDMEMEMEVKVPPNLSDDRDEEETAEIHIEEDEGFKMD